MEYKAVLIVKDDDIINDDTEQDINYYFEQGWEYVDSITPEITGRYNFRSGVMIILKRNIQL